MGVRSSLVGFAASWLSGASLFFAACASSPTPPSYPEQLDDSAAIQTSNTDEDDQWPRQIKSVDRQITVYPPQVEKWANNRIEQRAVVSVQTPASKAVYGLIWITARTSVDPQTKQVTFENVQFPRASFPSDPELADSVLALARQHSGDLFKPVASDQLRANREITQTESKHHKEPTLRHSPPRIFFEAAPAVLVLIDGKPALRESGVEGLLRVKNTRALVLRDTSSGTYYFALDNDRWMKAGSIQGPWTLAEDPPSSLNQAKQSALEQKQVDLVSNNEWDDDDVIPKVIVSTQPAVLLQSQGEPKLQSVDGTHLLYVENTKDQIFLNEIDQDYYTLISGRWYRAGSLKGPWKFVSAKKLPADFAKIPESSRKGVVLSSVAGTPQAKESAISNQAPQTAKVDRNEAKLDVEYDGTPRFKSVSGTSLKYAVNSVTPVIEVSSSEYYAVQKGVWFRAQSPEGPWKVADHVPSEIYSIPPSSPIYYVTYVRVYDSTPDHVYVSYTPGYLGSYYSNDGVVVYGTGYYSPPWIGTIWVGAPFTYWWGPWWGWATFPAYPYYPYYPYVVVSAPPANAPNVYQGWSSQAVPSNNVAAYNQPFTGGTTQSPATGAADAGAGWGPAQPAAPQAPPMNAPFMGGGWGPSVAPPMGGGGGGAPAGGGGGAAGQAFQGGGWGAKK